MNTNSYPREGIPDTRDTLSPFQALPAPAAESSAASLRNDANDIDIPVMNLRAVLVAAMLLAGALSVVFWLFL